MWTRNVLALLAFGIMVIAAADVGIADEYADSVYDYSPMIISGEPTAPHRVPENALGVPDYAGINLCDDACAFASLGDGGSITLEFVDNVLTGSGDATQDLWIYEVGPDVEDTFVEISQDAIVWHSVGKVFGSTAGIDIDAYGFGPLDSFSYVRLTDDTNEGGQSGPTVGADIDAVAAISVQGCLITAVAPMFPWSAGDQILITGVGFLPGSTPYINGAVASPFQVNTSVQITATVPAIADGSYVLSVQLPTGSVCEYEGNVIRRALATWGTLKTRYR